MTADEARALGCPVISTDYTRQSPMSWHHKDLDRVREESAFTWNDSTFGFWMINRYDHVREALQSPELFTNDKTSALGNPEAKPMLLPQNLNGAEHMAYRHVLNPWFAPAAMDRLAPFARRRCIEMLDELAPRGACDLTVDFALAYPTEMFLAHLGLPTEDGPFLIPLVEAMFRGFFGGDPSEMAATVDTLKGYFGDKFEQRRAQPADDFVTYLTTALIDGAPLPPDDAITLAFTIMLAGLDTTRSALGFIFMHLAKNPDDRRWLVEDPSRIPQAVEEFVRLYGLLIQSGRMVAEDVDFHGCPLRKGDIVWLGLASANRDPRQFEQPDEFLRDRRSNRHLGFGAGPHRCLGAHMARKELIIVLEEWLARIPEFGIVEGTELRERGGQLMLASVPLEWEWPQRRSSVPA